MKRSALARKTPLLRKAPIWGSTKATAPKKRKTLEQKTTRELIKEADKWYSRYVRLRDSEQQADGSWAGECIEQCGKLVVVLSPEGKWLAGSNLGHYVGRAHMALRFDEYNTNLQAAFCNAWRDKIAMLDGYKKGLDLKYGNGVARRLKRQASETRKLTKPELLQIISDSKTYVDYTLKHPV